MASAEVYRQEEKKGEKLWRFLAVGIAAVVILAALVDSIDLKMSKL